MQQRNRITYIQDLGEETAWKAVIWKTQMYFIYTPIYGLFDFVCSC